MVGVGGTVTFGCVGVTVGAGATLGPVTVDIFGAGVVSMLIFGTAGFEPRGDIFAVLIFGAGRVGGTKDGEPKELAEGTFKALPSAENA